MNRLRPGLPVDQGMPCVLPGDGAGSIRERRRGGAAPLVHATPWTATEEKTADPVDFPQTGIEFCAIFRYYWKCGTV